MTARLGLALALLFLTAAAEAAASEARVLPVPGGVAAVTKEDGDAVVTGGDGRRWRLSDDMSLVPFSAPPRPRAPLPPDALPDATVVGGRDDIRRAWLAEPTRRYRHAVLGDAVEAGALTVETAAGAVLTYRLPPDEVIEDLRPRVVDLDGDGRDEVLVVVSHVDLGAALTAFGLRDHELRRLASTPPIGQPYRWLNPVGVADFDGDGDREVALVRTPHIDGVLEIHAYGAEGFRRLGSLPGFSNHVVGSRSLDMAALTDIDGDGVVDLVLPSADRRRLRAVTFAGGSFAELMDIPQPAPVATDIVVTENPRRLIAGLENGRLSITEAPRPR